VLEHTPQPGVVLINQPRRLSGRHPALDQHQDKGLQQQREARPAARPRDLDGPDPVDGTLDPRLASVKERLVLEEVQVPRCRQVRSMLS